MKWKTSHTVLSVLGLLVAGVGLAIVEKGGWKDFVDDRIDWVSRALNDWWKRIAGVPPPPARPVPVATNLPAPTLLVLRSDRNFKVAPRTSFGPGEKVRRQQGSDLSPWLQLLPEQPVDSSGRPYQFPRPSIGGNTPYGVFPLSPGGAMSTDGGGVW